MIKSVVLTFPRVQNVPKLNSGVCLLEILLASPDAFRDVVRRTLAELLHPSLQSKAIRHDLLGVYHVVQTRGQPVRAVCGEAMM